MPQPWGYQSFPVPRTNPGWLRYDNTATGELAALCPSTSLAGGLRSARFLLLKIDCSTLRVARLVHQFAKDVAGQDIRVGARTA